MRILNHAISRRSSHLDGIARIAGQPWQFRNGVSDKTLYGSPIKPLHIAGNYPQLNFRLAGAQPCHSPRDTRIGLRRIKS